MTNILQEYAFNLAYARLLVADVSHEAMCLSGGAGRMDCIPRSVGHSSRVKRSRHAPRLSR